MEPSNLKDVFDQIDAQFTTERSEISEIQYGNVKAPMIPKEIFSKYLHARAGTKDPLDKSSYKNAYKFYTKHTPLLSRIRTFFKTILLKEDINLEKINATLKMYSSVKRNISSYFQCFKLDGNPPIFSKDKADLIKVSDADLVKFSEMLVKNTAISTRNSLEYGVEDDKLVPKATQINTLICNNEIAYLKGLKELIQSAIENTVNDEVKQNLTSFMERIDTSIRHLSKTHKNDEYEDYLVKGFNLKEEQFDILVQSKSSEIKTKALNNFHKRIAQYMKKSINKNKTDKLTIMRNAFLGVYDKDPNIDDTENHVDYSSKEFLSAASDLETLFGEGVSHFIKNKESYDRGMDLFFYDAVQMYGESGYLDPSLKHLSYMVSRSHMLFSWNQWGLQNSYSKDEALNFIQNDCAMMSSSMFDSLRDISNHMNGEYPKLEDLPRYREIISEGIWDDCNYFIEADCIKQSDGSYKDPDMVENIKNQLKLFFGEQDWELYFNNLTTGSADEIQNAKEAMKERFTPFFTEMTKQLIYSEEPNWNKIHNALNN